MIPKSVKNHSYCAIGIISKLTQKVSIISAAVNLEELPFEAIVRLLEEGQQDSPNKTVKAHPQVFT